MKFAHFNRIFILASMLIGIVLFSCSRPEPPTITDDYGVIPYDAGLRSEMRQLRDKADTQILPNMTSDEFFSIIFKKYKTLLDRHPNSIHLLLELCFYGSHAYTEECLTYAEKAITLDPTIAKSYIQASICYQRLGKYRKALSTLKKGEKVLAFKMVHDLRKDRPYYEPRYHPHSPKEINFAKAFLRKLGYDPGEDVTYEVPPEQLGMKDGECIMLAAYPLNTSAEFTSIHDLHELDTITYYIKRIKEKYPLYSPDEN